MSLHGRTGNTRYVKQLNKQSILNLLKQRQMSRADIAKEASLSKPCVSSLVEEMMQSGWIREIGIGDSTGGRKPIMLEYNSRTFAVVGAVFEGSRIQMVIADLHGDLLAKHEAKLPLQTSGEIAIQELERGLNKLLAQTGFEKDKVLGIGVGLPGITRRRDGTINYAQSTGWMGLPVQQEIEARLGLPVLIDNDVNMMTLGEYSQGTGKAFSNQVYMYVGTGIGAGIILDGQLYRGSSEAAGEIGYMMIGPLRKHLVNEYGLFESHYAVSGIRKKAENAGIALDEQESVIAQLYALETQGVAEARQLLDETFMYWAFGIANVLSVLDPELFILNGEFIHIQDHDLLKMIDALKQWVPAVPPIRKATLGSEAGMIGAVHSVLAFFANKMPDLL